MPTNKLWLEHTEHAAWEAVQVLRDKLAQAERRLERSAPPVGGWQKLLEQLDAVNARLALGADDYAEIVQRLLDRVTLLERRARTAEAASQRAPVAPFVISPVETDDEFDDDNDDDFMRAVQRRQRALARANYRLDAVLDAIETKVDQLDELDPAELGDAAVELAALAQCMARAGRRR
jgi:hypothetical protein